MPADLQEKPTTTWPELAESFYSFLTGRGATIDYKFDNLEVQVPSAVGTNSPSAMWKMNGKISITTSEK